MKKSDMFLRKSIEAEYLKIQQGKSVTNDLKLFDLINV